MSARYDRERIHRLFLEEKGDVRAVLRHPDTPRQPRTVAKYAQEGDWYADLSSNTGDSPVIDFDMASPAQSASINEPVANSAAKSDMKQTSDVAEDNDVERLRRIRSVLYQFLVPGTWEGLDMLELRPKTYTEAVKCYMDVDSRIDEKKGKGTSSVLDRWEKIVLRCLPSPKVVEKEVEDESITDRDGMLFGNGTSIDQ